MRKILLSTFVLLLVSSSVTTPFPGVFQKKSFSTLNDLESLSSKLPELPESDSKNLARPDFKSFYETYEKSFFKRTWGKVKGLFGRKKKPIWSPGTLKDVALRVSEYRRKHLKNFVKEENRINPTGKAKFISFGNIHGSYHSLVRCLKQLQNMGSINNELKILSGDTYIVFTGDIIGYAPFGMETMTAVLMLMDKNPEKVFFLKGKNDSKNLWSKNGFGQEMEYKIKKTKDFVDFKKSLDGLFSTLPSSLYISKKDGVITRLIKFSSLLNDSVDKAVDICITGDNGFTPLDGKFGLRKIRNKSGFPVCKLFSAPNFVNRKLRKFYNDSFVIFSIDENFAKSSFDLYTKDSRKNDTFKKKVCYAFQDSSDNATRYDQEIDKVSRRLTALKEKKDKLVVDDSVQA